MEVIEPFPDPLLLRRDSPGTQPAGSEQHQGNLRPRGFQESSRENPERPGWQFLEVSHLPEFSPTFLNGRRAGQVPRLAEAQTAWPRTPMPAQPPTSVLSRSQTLFFPKAIFLP